MDTIDAPTEKSTAMLLIEVGADLAQVEALRERLARFQSERIRNYIVDLDNADFVKSAALAFLIDLKDQCESEGGKMTLLNVSESARAILRLTRLEEVLIGADFALP